MVSIKGFRATPRESHLRVLEALLSLLPAVVACFGRGCEDAIGACVGGRGGVEIGVGGGVADEVKGLEGAVEVEELEGAVEVRLARIREEVWWKGGLSGGG